MSSGTIALTNNSATVTGTGTSFTTELKPGDFVYVTVGGAPYTLVASTVTSDTQLTLAVAYDGPTTTGLAWNAVPASLQVAITQKILNDFALVARGRILDFQNWQKIFSSDSSVTVMRPDRTTFTGPSWGYLVQQISDVVQQIDEVVEDVNTKPSISDVRALIDACLPIGSPIYWPSLALPDSSANGVKFLRLNGANFNTTTYTKLAAIYPSGVLPDMRGNVIRGFDDGRGIDQGRSLLAEQLGAAPDIVGTMNVRRMFTGSAEDATIFSGGGAVTTTTAQSSTSWNRITQANNAGVNLDRFIFQASSYDSTYGRASEVRMRNMAWNMIVRAS